MPSAPTNPDRRMASARPSTTTGGCTIRITLYRQQENRLLIYNTSVPAPRTTVMNMSNDLRGAFPIFHHSEVKADSSRLALQLCWWLLKVAQGNGGTGTFLRGTELGYTGIH